MVKPFPARFFPSLRLSPLPSRGLVRKARACDVDVLGMAYMGNMGMGILWSVRPSGVLARSARVSAKRNSRWQKVGREGRIHPIP